MVSLYFCLATQMVENSSVVGFAWRGSSVLFGVLRQKDKSPSLTGMSPRPLEALKSICEMYKTAASVLFTAFDPSPCTQGSQAPHCGERSRSLTILVSFTNIQLEDLNELQFNELLLQMNIDFTFGKCNPKTCG